MIKVDHIGLYVSDIEAAKCFFETYFGAKAGEMYRDMHAYKSHIQSEHFQAYKQGTLHMVKSLDIVDMYPLNPDRMNEIFIKLKEQQ